jgi:RHS repeat-associated protein
LGRDWWTTWDTSFGNARSTNRPAPTIPAGTGGDFRFHGLWQETNSSLYHVRARDYDPRTGRFLSRDPLEGVSKLPETFHPYAFANNNPFMFEDPAGAEFTILGVSITGNMQNALQVFRTYAINRAKNKITDTIVDSFGHATLKVLGHFYPGADKLIGIFQEGADVFASGVNHENQVLGRLCKVLPTDIASYLYLETPIRANGEATEDGYHCPPTGTNLGFPGKGIARPDFVFGDTPPTKTRKNGGPKSIFIGDLKLSGNSLYNQYVEGNKQTQFNALVNYANQRTYTRSVVFITVFSGERSKITKVNALLRKKGLEKGVMLFIFSAVKNKNY